MSVGMLFILSFFVLMVTPVVPIALSALGVIEDDQRLYKSTVGLVKRLAHSIASHRIASRCAMLCYAVLCCAMLCYAVLCGAMRCCAVLCCAMRCDAMSGPDTAAVGGCVA
jgi:hypothetical protein